MTNLKAIHCFFILLANLSLTTSVFARDLFVYDLEADQVTAQNSSESVETKSTTNLRTHSNQDNKLLLNNNKFVGIQLAPAMAEALAGYLLIMTANLKNSAEYKNYEQAEKNYLKAINMKAGAERELKLKETSIAKDKAHKAWDKYRSQTWRACKIHLRKLTGISFTLDALRVSYQIINEKAALPFDFIYKDFQEK